MTRPNPICVCTRNMCHKPVHDLVRICTYDHAHHISNTYVHDPHHAHLVEIKHNAYMLALHSRDAYDCAARLDRRYHPHLVHMTYHSRDRIVPCVRNSSRFACSYYSRDPCICQVIRRLLFIHFIRFVWVL